VHGVHVSDYMHQMSALVANELVGLDRGHLVLSLEYTLRCLL